MPLSLVAIADVRVIVHEYPCSEVTYMLKGPIMSTGGRLSSQTGPPTCLRGPHYWCDGTPDKPEGTPNQVWVTLRCLRSTSLSLRRCSSLVEVCSTQLFSQILLGHTLFDGFLCIEYEPSKRKLKKLFSISSRPKNF